MKKPTKKMVAPLVITVLMVAYYAGLAAAAFALRPPVIVCILAVVIPALLGGLMIAMCKQRIQEIRSGEEDDLSQY
ncbi:MAG: hypothetical protein Q4F17_07190 [Eubacteriales bacterium]|nr:hypothetical protein [Eubacteriales bacterium]